MTDQELKDLIASTAAIQAETAKQMRETKEFIKESAREADKRKRELDSQMRETDKRLKLLSQDIGGVSHSNALVAEEYFFNALKDKLEFGGMHFDLASLGEDRCVKLPDGSQIEGQYDIILANGEAVAIIEVKYKVRTEDVDKILKTDIYKFRRLYPEYKNYKLYFGIAGLNLNKHVEKRALESGIGVLRQKGKIAEILGSNLRAF